MTEHYDQYSYDPDDRYDDDDLDHDDEHEFVNDCGDPKCLMNFAPHMRSECHTLEMLEAYERECNPPWYVRLMEWLRDLLRAAKGLFVPAPKRCRNGDCVKFEGHEGDCDDLPF